MRKVISALVCIVVLLFVSVSLADANRSITINSDTNAVFLKKQLKLQADVSKATDDAPAQTALVWESDHPEIAKVNNGVVAGVSVGKAKITVSAKDDPSISASIEIEVQVPVKTVKPEQARLEMYVGENYKDEAELKVEILPEEAFYKDVTFSSSNEKVVTVDEKGKVTAVGAGNAKITIASNEPGSTAKAFVNVVVKQAIDKIVFEEQEFYVAEKQSKTVKPGFEPKSASNKQLEWTSQDESIAKVANNGSITGVSCGMTTVTATAKDTGIVKETITVNVIKPIKKISVDYPKLTLEPGIDWKQKITIAPEDASITSLKWSSSSEKIATVDENGKISPIAPGKCTVTGVSQDGYNAKVQVSVEVKKHDVVITSPGETKVDFAVKDYQTMAGMQVGNMFWGTIWKTTVKYQNKCVKPSDSSSDNRLIPVKPGSDIISIVEKENKKITSKKKYTVFVARSAVEKEDKEETNESTIDTDLDKQDQSSSVIVNEKEDEEAYDESAGTDADEKSFATPEAAFDRSEGGMIVFEGLPWGASYNDVKSILEAKNYAVMDLVDRKNVFFTKIRGIMKVGKYEAYSNGLSFRRKGRVLNTMEYIAKSSELIMIDLYFDTGIPFEDLKQNVMKSIGLSDDDLKSSDAGNVWNVNGVIVELMRRDSFYQLSLTCENPPALDSSETKDSSSAVKEKTELDENTVQEMKSKASDINSKISFQDVPWGISLPEFQDSKYYDKTKYTVSSFLDGSGESLNSYKEIKIAGYAVDEVHLYFTNQYDEETGNVYDKDLSMFYQAYCHFSDSNYSKPNSNVQAVYDSLSAKLQKDYGESEAFSEEGISWNDNGVTVELTKNKKSIYIKYTWQEGLHIYENVKKMVKKK